MIGGVFPQLGMPAPTLTPLSETEATSLNSATANHLQTSQQNNFMIYADNDSMEGSTPPSSPFVANVSESVSDSENTTRLNAKSPIDREHTSPLKMLKSRASPMPSSQTPQRAESMRSPRKISSPDKRFPVKISSPEKPRPTVVEISIEDVLRDNEGLTKAIQILEDEDSMLNEGQSVDDTMASMQGGIDADETAGIDDTFVSTFSTFSAVPDMTSFAKIGPTPTKYSGPTPRRTLIETPATARRPQSVIQNRSYETPRQQRYGTRDDTNLILDFTDQINGFAGYNHPSPARTGRNSPLKSAPDMPWASTPTVNRNTMSNLLDFDIPPAPTPRSMPSITPRELESLKSNFLSEISSLKASLSGKEAEVNSLKTAVGDAEKRVGESAEQVREERSLKEQLIFEKEEWEKRGREMEAVLRNVKEEIVHGERERDELEGRLQECEGRREAAEMMAQEAESKMAAMRAGKVSPLSESTNSETSKSGDCNNCGGGKAVEVAVEKVSRELHTLYKEKHESKVAALKKSYEKRWEKRIRELEYQIEDISKENDELRLGRDNTMTKVEPKNPLELTIDLEKQAARDARTKELEAELEGLTQVINSVKLDNSDLRRMLDEERVEKGKLVAAVDEMIPLVAAFDDMLANMDSVPENLPSATPSNHHHHPVSQPSHVENLRGSISRASGLRAPASVKKNPPTESRIGRGGFGAPAGHERTKSVISQGTSRPGSGMGYTSRSGIMNSIEKMGSYKGRGGE